MQRKLIGICCAAAIGLSCVSVFPVSAINQPSYSDFVDFLVSNYPNQKYFSYAFVEDVNMSDSDYSKYLLFYAFGDTYRTSSDYLYFDYSSSYNCGYIKCFGESSSGFSFNFNNNNVVSGYVRFYTISGYDCLQFGTYPASPHISYPANPSYFCLLNYVSNVDWGSQFFIEGDIDYSDVWNVDVTYTPSSSKDAVNKSPSGDSSDSGSGVFQLPDSWINGGQTLESGQAEDVGIDADAAFDALDELSFDAVNTESMQSGIGFIWTLFSKVSESFGIMPIIMICMFLLILAWFFGRSL